MPGEFDPTSRRDLIDRAAQIVALVENRESATRADYRHPRLEEIVRQLREVEISAAPAR